MQSLTLPSTQTHDFAVSEGSGGEVWRWSAGLVFAQMLTELTLEADESRTFSSTWDQVCNDGTPAAPGRYQLVGRIPVIDGEVSSAAVGFAIE